MKRNKHSKMMLLGLFYTPLRTEPFQWPLCSYPSFFISLSFIFNWQLANSPVNNNTSNIVKAKYQLITYKKSLKN